MKGRDVPEHVTLYRRDQNPELFIPWVIQCFPTLLGMHSLWQAHFGAGTFWDIHTLGKYTLGKTLCGTGSLFWNLLFGDKPALRLHSLQHALFRMYTLRDRHSLWHTIFVEGTLWWDTLWDISSLRQAFFGVGTVWDTHTLWDIHSYAQTLFGLDTLWVRHSLGQTFFAVVYSGPWYEIVSRRITTIAPGLLHKQFQSQLPVKNSQCRLPP